MNERSQVLVDDPGLAEALAGARMVEAARDCVARTIRLPRGSWSPGDDLGGAQGGIGLLVLEGLLVRRVGVAARFGAELLGEGDLLRPWQREDLATTLPRSGDWRALMPCRLAVLDADFALRARDYPEVISALFARTLRRSRMLAVNIAIVRQPRVDVRLEMLFWELADRWGKVHPDGVRVPLPLTHAVLSDLVAAQRQTVSTALGELAARHRLVWTGDAWLLSGTPPDELCSAVSTYGAAM
ncbi:MAG: Crp/Fnr family transcriptional regulator [Solirubrobacterales bacterium]|nr:Crp/Fnr family transcriptional regulator [Solirubrobacterales bacterium]MBV9536206.1 Crp/Fnr family transcriptional regulator [Solirubrobacterales bacterium]